MCIEINNLRIRSFSRTMAKVNRLAGVASVNQVDLQQVPAVRALAVAGQTARLECLLTEAHFHAGRAGFTEAVAAVGVKLAELHALKVEVRDRERIAAGVKRPPAIAALGKGEFDSTSNSIGKGKKGRGQQIRTWIIATGADVGAVAARFQLAKSTSQRYIREARKGVKRIAALAA